MVVINSFKKAYLPYNYKLILTFLVFVLMAVIIIGTSAYRTSVDSIREQANENINSILEQMRVNITYKAEEVKRISDQIYFDNKLQTYLRYYDSGWYSYELTKEYMMPVFSSAVNVFRESALLKVYLNNSSMPEVYNIQDQAIDPMRFSPDFEILQMDRLQEEDWLKELELQQESFRGTEVMWMQVENDRQFNNISLVRKLVDFEYRKQIGVVRTIVRLESLLNAVDFRKIGEGTEIVVLNDAGNVIKSSGIQAESNLTTIERRNSLAIEKAIPDLHLKLIVYIPNSLLEAGAKKVRTITIMVCFVSTITLLGIGFFLSGYFSRRVRKIIYSLNAFREGDFHKRIKFPGKDEFSQIAEEFNKMADNIEELIKEVYLANIQKSEAELESLQAQINPHFLYNTLSSMSRLAKFGELEKLDEMIMGLAKFYRLTLNKGRMLISIYHELEQVKTYIHIQQIKYGDRLNVWYDIPSDVLQYDTVKLILQPFVENVLEHALFGKKIHIRIVAKKIDKEIQFQIIDDGVGMSQETIRQIFTKDGIHIGYGIRNVDARIKLQFGQQYGVELFSIVGAGTNAKITIPAFIEK